MVTHKSAGIVLMVLGASVIMLLVLAFSSVLVVSASGDSWTALTHPTDDNLFGIACPSTSLCKAVGNNGTIVSWNGTSWSTDTSPTGDCLNGVACPSTSLCKAVGDNGTIASWNGTSWSTET